MTDTPVYPTAPCGVSSTTPHRYSILRVYRRERGMSAKSRTRCSIREVLHCSFFLVMTMSLPSSRLGRCSEWTRRVSSLGFGLCYTFTPLFYWPHLFHWCCDLSFHCLHFLCVERSCSRRRCRVDVARGGGDAAAGEDAEPAEGLFWSLI